jgi:hypothetical protein
VYAHDPLPRIDVFGAKVIHGCEIPPGHCQGLAAGWKFSDLQFRRAFSRRPGHRFQVGTQGDAIWPPNVQSVVLAGPVEEAFAEPPIKSSRRLIALPACSRSQPRRV